MEAQSTNGNVDSAQEYHVRQRQHSASQEARDEIASTAPSPLAPVDTAAQEESLPAPFLATDDRTMTDRTASVSQQSALLDTFGRRIVQGIVLRNSGATAARDLNSTRAFAQLQQLLAGSQSEHFTTSNVVASGKQRWLSVQSRLGPMGYAAAQAEVAAAKILSASYLSEGTLRVVGLVSRLVAAGPADLRTHLGIE